MADMIPMGKLLAAAKKEYPSLTTEELTDLIGLQIEVRQQQVKDEMKRARIGKAKGGNISGQMEMFEDGGLKDQGGTIDPVSGNDVPSGSTQEEVRDDIPAQLSEGEFVFPADVVRFIGLEKLMRIRQRAKSGLQMMEDMGQMGNSEEAIMPDDLPFSLEDLDMDDDEEYNDGEMDMAQGGVVYAANGFGGTTTRKSAFDNTAQRIQPMKYTPPPIPTSTPTGGFTYGSQEGANKGKLKFQDLYKDVGGPDEYRTYVNDAGAEIQVPFKDGKMLTGFRLPEGFKPKTDKVDTTTTQSAKTKSARVESTSDGGDSEVSDLGGARTTIGGVDYAVSYNFDGTVSLASVDDYKASGKANFNKVNPAIADMIKTQAIGQVSQLAKGLGLKTLAVNELAKKMGMKVPGVSKIERAVVKAKDIQKKFDKGMRPQDIFDMGKSYLDDEFKGRDKVDTKGVEGLSEKDMRDIQGGLEFGKDDQINPGLSDDFMDNVGKGIDKGISDDSFKDSTPTVDTSNNYDDNNDSDGGTSGGSDSSSMGDSGYGGGGGYSTAKGGFIPKLKPKPKKMKRGGLASR